MGDTLRLPAQLGSGFFWCVWHIMVFSILNQSVSVCECNVTVRKEVEQSSVCVKISKRITADLVGKIRAQACWEFDQLPSVMRTH